ncbi:unnamed protein product [Camellia sinensis]
MAELSLLLGHSEGTEETNKKNGVPATRLEVWMAGYSKDNIQSNDKAVDVMTQIKELGAQSNATDEEIITQVLGPERPGRVRTYGLGPSLTDVFGSEYRQSQEQTRIIQMQVQEQLNQYKAQMEIQIKEMMDAMLNQHKVQLEMQSTIQAQQARIEQLESQQAIGGPVAPAATHVYSQQQSHAYTFSFNCHRSSEEFTYQRKKRRRRRRSRYDKLNDRLNKNSITQAETREVIESLGSEGSDCGPMGLLLLSWFSISMVYSKALSCGGTVKPLDSKKASSEESVPWCTKVLFDSKRILSMVERILKLRWCIDRTTVR